MLRSMFCQGQGSTLEPMYPVRGLCRRGCSRTTLCSRRTERSTRTGAATVNVSSRVNGWKTTSRSDSAWCPVTIDQVDLEIGVVVGYVTTAWYSNRVEVTGMRSDVRWNKLTTGVQHRAKLSTSISMVQRRIGLFQEIQSRNGCPPSAAGRRCNRSSRKSEKRSGNLKYSCNNRCPSKARRIDWQHCLLQRQNPLPQCIGLIGHRDV